MTRGHRGRSGSVGSRRNPVTPDCPPTPMLRPHGLNARLSGTYERGGGAGPLGADGGLYLLRTNIDSGAVKTRHLEPNIYIRVSREVGGHDVTFLSVCDAASLSRFTTVCGVELAIVTLNRRWCRVV